MNLCSLIAFLGKYKINLSLKQDLIHYHSPIRIPEDILELIRQNKQLLIKTLEHYQNSNVIISPQSFNQQSLFFSYLMAPLSSSYNVVVPMKIFSQVNHDRIQTVLDSMIKYHDQLRATFQLISNNFESVPCQIIPFERKLSLIRIDVSGLSQQQIDNSIRDFCNNPFDLSASSAFRASLFSGNNSEHVLVFVFHHIICDAHSIGIFLENFNRLYFDNSYTLSLSDSYTDFVSHQIQFLEKNQQQLLNYWKIRSECDRGLPLISDRDPHSVKINKGKSLFFSINDEIVHKVNTLSHRLSITRFSFFFSCFQLLYMLKSGSFNSTIGVLSSGRSNSRFLKTIGYFVNPLPVFCNRPGTLRLEDHLKMTHKEICELLDNQNLPFSLLVGNISVERKAERPVLFSAVFNMLSRKQLDVATDLVYPDKKSTDITFCGMNIKPYHVNQQEGQFDITLELLERDNHIQGILKYNSELFTDNTAEEFVFYYNSILKEATCTSAYCIDEFLSKFKKNENFTDLQDQRWHLTVAATFTANILQESFHFWESVTGIGISSVFSPYYALEQFLLDPEIPVSEQPLYAILLLRLEDLAYQNDNEHNIDIEYIRKRAFDLTELIIKFSRERSIKIIIIFCPASFVVSNNQELRVVFTELERNIIEQFNPEQNILIISSDRLMETYDCSTTCHSIDAMEAKVPYTEIFYAHLGMTIIRTVYAFEKPPCKAIILDCDNTLWTGVAGEDPVNQISISDQEKKFHFFLKNCKEKGIPLCLCSKNNRQDVVSVFEKHPDMILKIPDISFERINWQSKSQNIAEMAEEANLSTTGMIFIDDNPTECAEVKANFPDITVVHLEDTINDRIGFIKNFWAFDAIKVTAEDLSRIEKYRVEKFRTDFKNQASSFSEFINGLKLQINIRSSALKDIPRISELSFRTNQFTTGTKGLSEQIIHDSMKKYDYFVVEVSDRFGDYGLVGVFKGRKKMDLYVVDFFFLSCRTLGRGVEHRCLSFIGDHALGTGCQTVEFTVHVTARNKPLQLFFQSTLSAYQSINDSMMIFRVPCFELHQITFNPEEYSRLSLYKNQKFKPMPSASNRFCLSDSILKKIALEYSKADTLHQLILSMRKMKRLSTEVVEKVQACPSQRSIDSSIEEVLHQIWSDSLGKESINVNQNFFDAGGNSIMLPHIIQRIQQLLNKSISLVEFFQYPTISSLAAHLSSKTADPLNCNQSNETALQHTAFNRFKSGKAS